MPNALTIHLPHRLHAVSARVVGGPSSGAGAAPNEASEPERIEQMLQHERQRLAAETAALAGAREALNRCAAQFQALQAELLGEAEGQLVDLALEIARKVMMQEIACERHRIDEIVREALSKVPAGKEVVVRLHPDDLARCEMGQAKDGPGEAKAIRFAGDPGVARASCVLETAGGLVEFDVESMLAEIGQALKNPE